MKKINIKTIFINYDFIIYPLLLVFGSGSFLYFTKITFFADYLKLKDFERIYELFNLIINSLVSLIGIYITVSLVAYEFFKQKTGIDIQKSFLVNKRNAYFITFTISTILCAFVSSIVISETNPTNNELTLIYFNAILFSMVIILLIPVSFNLFSSLRPEKIANEEIHKLSIETILLERPKDITIDEQTELLENDPLFKIENIVIALISVKDILKARAIIQKTTFKLSSLIIDSEDSCSKRLLIERLISFQIRIIDFSITQPNNSLLLKSIWISIDDMYTILIKRNKSVNSYGDFQNQFFERYFNRLLITYNEEIIFVGIKALRVIIQNQIMFNLQNNLKIGPLDILKNSIDPTFDLPNEYSDDDYEYSSHFEGIANDLMDCFYILINKGIKNNHPDLINKCFDEIYELNFQFYLHKVDENIRSYFYLKTSKTICSYTYQAFEQSIFIEGHDATRIIPHNFESLIEKNQPVAREILRNYCYLLIDLQKINKLDRWFLGGLKINNVITTLGELGFIAKRCAIKHNDGLVFQNCLNDCIETFIILKELYEKQLPQDFGLYLTIKTQFDNILFWLIENNSNDKELIQKLNILIESFKENDSPIP